MYAVPFPFGGYVLNFFFFYRFVYTCSIVQYVLSITSSIFRYENPMVVNMCLRHVMFGGCKWMQVFASDCSWLHLHTH